MKQGGNPDIGIIRRYGNLFDFLFLVTRYTKFIRHNNIL